MRKITVEMYVSDTNPNIKFVPAKGGGFITLVDPNSIKVTQNSLFSSTQSPLSDIGGVGRQIMDAKVELAQFIRSE